MSEVKTLIETVKDTIKRFVVKEGDHDVHIDFIDPQTGDIGLFPIGPTLVKSDVLGNKTYKMIFEMYSQRVGFEDFDRIDNVRYFSNLVYKLNNLKHVKVLEPLETYMFFGADTFFNDYSYLSDEEHIPGWILDVNAGNGLKYSVPTGDINDGIIYQMQITVTYKLLMSEVM